MVHVSDEYNNAIMRDWTEKLWQTNEIAKGNAPKDVSLYEKGRPFADINESRLSRLQHFNEQSFVLTCYGLAFLPRAWTDNDPARTSTKPESLFDVWRRSVLRNRQQAFFTAFEKCLDECLKNSGEEAAIAAYPKNLNPKYMVDTLEYLQLEYKLLSKEKLTALLGKVEQKMMAEMDAKFGPRCEP